MFTYFADIFMLGREDQNAIQDFIDKNEKLSSLQMFQYMQSATICTFIFNLIKQENKQLQEKVKKILSFQIESSIKRVYKQLSSFNQKNKHFMYHLGISYVHFILFLFLLGEQPLTYNGVLVTFKECFSLTSNKDVEEFSMMIIYILNFYLPQEISEINENMYLNLVEQINENQIVKWLEMNNYTWSSFSTKYDAHILLYQIIYLITPQSNNISFKILQDLFINMEKTNIYRIKNSLFSSQLFFDQTPIINIFGDFQYKYFGLQEKYFKKAIQSTIISVVNQHENSIIMLSELKQQLQFYILDQNQVNENLKEIGEVCEVRNQFIKNKNIEQQYHIFNMGRNLTVNSQFSQKARENLNYITENQNFFIELFDFQNQLIIKEFSDYGFFQYLYNALVNYSISDILPFLNKYFIFFQITIEMLKYLPHLFTEEQIEAVKQIEEDFYIEVTLKNILNTYEKFCNEDKKFNKHKHIKNFIAINQKIFKNKFCQNVES